MISVAAILAGGKGTRLLPRSGKLPNFTGIGSEYQPPKNPSLTIETEGRTVAESAKILVELILNDAHNK